MVKSTVLAVELTAALNQLHDNLGQLLSDLAGIHSAARADDPELANVCLHIETLIMEAEAVLSTPALLSPVAMPGTMH
jgi:hypothetical protein